MKNLNRMARKPLGRLRRLAPWLNRTARSLMITGTLFVLGTEAWAEESARPILLAPQPLTLSTGETGFISRSESTAAAQPAPRVTRGASPEPAPMFGAIPSAPSDGGLSGPPLPLPQTVEPTAVHGMPMRPMTPPNAIRQMPTKYATKANGAAPRMHPSGSCVNCKQQGFSEFGSGWRNLMNRLFGKSTPPTSVTQSRYPGVTPVVRSPVAPTSAPTQMAYRWYGYGAPLAGNPPQMADATPMPSNWYTQTGATVGAMPVNGMGMATPAMASRVPQTVPFEQAYGPLERSPVVQAGHERVVGESPDTTKVGAVRYTPPQAGVAPTHNHSMAQATLSRHDLIPPPPLPPVRWQSPTSDVPSLPTGQRTPTGNAMAALRQEPHRQVPLAIPQAAQRPLQQAPLVTQGEQRAANLQAPQPYQGATRGADVAATSMAQNSARPYVVRAQSDSDEPSFTDQLAERLQKYCGKYATIVEVKQTAKNALAITMIVHVSAHAEPIANKLSALPELANFEVDFEVRTK